MAKNGKINDFMEDTSKANVKPLSVNNDGYHNLIMICELSY